MGGGRENSAWINYSLITIEYERTKRHMKYTDSRD